MSNPYHALGIAEPQIIVEPQYVDWGKRRLFGYALVTASLVALVVFIGKMFEDAALQSILSTQKSVTWNSLPVWFLLIHHGRFALAGGIVTALFGLTTADGPSLRTMTGIVFSTAFSFFTLFAIQRIPATWYMTAMGWTAALTLFLFGTGTMAAIVCWVRHVPIRLPLLTITTPIASTAFAVVTLFCLAWTFRDDDTRLRAETITFAWSAITIVHCSHLLQPATLTDAATRSMKVTSDQSPNLTEAG